MVLYNWKHTEDEVRHWQIQSHWNQWRIFTSGCVNCEWRHDFMCRLSCCCGSKQTHTGVHTSFYFRHTKIFGDLAVIHFFEVYSFRNLCYIFLRLNKLLLYKENYLILISNHPGSYSAKIIMLYKFMSNEWWGNWF